VNLDAPTRARLPAAALAALADLRPRPDLYVLPDGDHCWLRWERDSQAITLRLLPVAGATLFERRGDLWFPAGKLLPVAGVPDDRHPGWKHFAAIVLPAKIEPHREALAGWSTVGLRLVPGGDPRLATALRSPFPAVRAWCDTVTNAEMARYRAAWHDNEVLLVGDNPPSLTPGRRYHGQRVLLPLGFTLDPPLPLPALVEILELAAGEMALLDEGGVEIVEESQLVPLTRAAVNRCLTLSRGSGRADIQREDA
jgi:hypothetical protein